MKKLLLILIAVIALTGCKDSGEAFAKKTKEKVIIQHSVNDFNTLPKYPKFLK